MSLTPLFLPVNSPILPRLRLRLRPRISISRPIPPTALRGFGTRSLSFPQLPSQHPISPVPSPSPKRAETSLPFRLFGRTWSIPGRIILFFVPIIWATYGISLKWLYRLPWALPPPIFNFIRLLLGAVVILPRFLKYSKSQTSIQAPRAMDILTGGMELGFWVTLANTTQILGLRYTTASRGAFISQLYTVMVPLFAFVCGMESSLPLNVIVASLLSVLGVAMLTLDGPAGFSLGGDAFMILCACASTVYMLRSKFYANRVPAQPFVATKVIGQAFFATVYLIISSIFTKVSLTASLFVGATPKWLLINAFIVLWGALGLSVFSADLQIRGMKLVSASESVIIFSTTPLWSLLFAIPLGERLGPRGAIGAAIILCATILASGVGLKKKPQQPKVA